MKVASIVLNSLGIVIYLVLAIASLSSGTAASIFAIFYFVPIITSIISIIIIATSKRKSGGFTFQGIMDLLFGNLLGGIFMLCIDEQDLKKKTVETSAKNGENKQ